MDLCIITKGKVEYLRPYDIANKKGERLVEGQYCLVHSMILMFCSVCVELETIATNQAQQVCVWTDIILSIDNHTNMDVLCAA